MENRPDSTQGLAGTVVHALLWLHGQMHPKRLRLAGTSGYSDPIASGRQVMRIRTLIVTLSLLAAAAPAAADARSDAKKQVEFGIEVAQRGLWREAVYRWERATQIDPTYAAALNNLAVAYEHEGDLEKARVAYEKATGLEPNNASIKQNYELFKEINDRTTRPATQ